MIYLDNAATTFPKPTQVTEEVMRCLSRYCGNPGRGAHPLSLFSAERIFACREALSDFLGLGAPERILFTANTTYALNLALKGLLKHGDHVLISELEHNAVRRPLCRLREEKNVSFTCFPVLGQSDKQILSNLQAIVRPNTRAVICAHTSNICNLTLPLSLIGAFCHRRGIRFIVDAAQSAGHLPIDMRKMHIDALALPGHKGLYGIQGAGVLAISKDLDLPPLAEGGSGAHSFSEEMPQQPPERFEPGTLPTPAIVSLLEGVHFIQSRTLSAVHAQETALFEAAAQRLESIPGITVYAREHPGAVLLFNHNTISPEAVAAHLAENGICTRAGYHCAPLAHEALGTKQRGAVRLSFSLFNTLDEIDTLWHLLKQN